MGRVENTKKSMVIGNLQVEGSQAVGELKTVYDKLNIISDNFSISIFGSLISIYPRNRISITVFDSDKIKLKYKSEHYTKEDGEPDYLTFSTCEINAEKVE